MSRELNDFSAQIDEQFDLSDVTTNSFWVFFVAIFA